MKIKNKLKEIREYLWAYPYIILICAGLILWSIGIFSVIKHTIEHIKMRNINNIERNLNEKDSRTSSFTSRIT